MQDLRRLIVDLTLLCSLDYFAAQQTLHSAHMLKLSSQLLLQRAVTYKAQLSIFPCSPLEVHLCDWLNTIAHQVGGLPGSMIHGYSCCERTCKHLKQRARSCLKKYWQVIC